VSVVFGQVQIAAMGLSLFQKSPTECGVSECDSEVTQKGDSCSLGGWGGGGFFFLKKKKIFFFLEIFFFFFFLFLFF